MHKFLATLLLIIFVMLATSAEAANGSRKKDKLKRSEDVLNALPDPEPPMYIDVQLARPKQPVGDNAKSTVKRHIYINPEYNPREGIDVSHYQGTIDWATLASSKEVSFAFVKACEATGYIDKYYQYNMSEGKKYGIAMGSYHFWRANVDQDKQFQHLISIVKREECDIIPIIDVEAANGVGVSTFCERLHYFLELCEQYYGVKPIIYTYVSFYNKYLLYQNFDEYPLFMAYYGASEPSVKDGRAYMMWQYTSKGRLPGIGKGPDKNVDRSRFVGNFGIDDIIYNPAVSIPSSSVNQRQTQHQQLEQYEEYPSDSAP